MEWNYVMFGVLVLTLALQGEGAPTSRRSRASKLLTDRETNRETKLTTEFKEAASSTSPSTPTKRKNKALGLLGFFPSFLSSALDYAEDDDDDVTFSVNDENFDDEDLSRTIPSRRPQNKKKPSNGNMNNNNNLNNNNINNNNQNYQNDNVNSLQYDSPIFYIRIPPTPYMFVPGLGYVSQPPNLGPPMSPVPQVADPFINLPLDFVSNAKPTGVYQWSGAPGYPQVPQVQQMPIDPYGFGAPAPQPVPQPQRPNYNTPSYSKKPKPAQSNSKLTNLKGQYTFNGKPNDSVYVLRDTYNSIYSDALQNFYP